MTELNTWRAERAAKVALVLTKSVQSGIDRNIRKEGSVPAFGTPAHDTWMENLTVRVVGQLLTTEGLDFVLS